MNRRPIVGENCEVCGKSLRGGTVFYECPDGLPGHEWLACESCHARRDSGATEPTDEEIYNRPGVEGGVGYPLFDGPGSLGENDPRLGYGGP